MNAPLLETVSLHFSVSQMRAWIACPRKFEFRYVLGAEQEFMPMPLVFGTAFHSALATHYQGLMRGALVSRDEVKQRFIDELTLAKDGPVPLQEDDDGTGFGLAIHKGTAMLDVTLDHPTAQPAKVLGVEQPFTVDLYDPESGAVLDERLKGVIDLVVEEDGHRCLVEHKSSSKKYTSDQLVYDTQLSGYAYAAAQLGWGEVGLRFSVTTKTKSPAVQVEDVLRDDLDKMDFLRTAVGVLKAIDAGVSFPIRGWACKGCPYKARCQAER